MYRNLSLFGVNNMNELSELLMQCKLFKGFDEKVLVDFINTSKYVKKVYKKNEIIAFEGANCISIGIILSGNVEMQRIYESGRVVVMERLFSGNIFGEVIIFSDYNTYPATIMAAKNTAIVYISKENVLLQCSKSGYFLNNFMGLLSDKILMLNRKIKNMSYQTIAQKLANYIIEEHKKQKSMKIRLNQTRKEIAEQMGIPRPSLSRELMKLRDKKIIIFDKNYVEVRDIEALESILFMG